MSSPDRPHGTVEISKTADEALQVLLELGRRGGQTPAELARALDLNRTVVHRHLATLAARGFVRRCGTDPVYVLGGAVLELAQGVEPAIRSVALPVMRDLAAQTAETVLLFTPDLSQDPPCVTILDQVLAERHVVRVAYRLGHLVPLPVSAGGRAVLAFLGDPAARERAIAAAADPARCRRQVAEIAAAGYAASRDELLRDVSGIAGPVLDDRGHALASLSIAAPVSRHEELTDLVPALLRATRDVSARLQQAAAFA
jgi:IclR family transcriptional regulator, acetate operon repressor